jgi:hypothetical protein
MARLSSGGGRVSTRPTLFPPGHAVPQVPGYAVASDTELVRSLGTDGHS